MKDSILERQLTKLHHLLTEISTPPRPLQNSRPQPLQAGRGKKATWPGRRSQLEDTLLSKCYRLSLSSCVLRCHGQETWPSWGRGCGDTVSPFPAGGENVPGGWRSWLGHGRTWLSPNPSAHLTPGLLSSRPGGLGTMPRAAQGLPSFPAPTRALLALGRFSGGPVPVLGWAHRLHRLLALSCF